MESNNRNIASIPGNISFIHHLTNATEWILATVLITEQTQDDSQVRIPQFFVHCTICVHVEMCDGLSCSCLVKSTTESKAFSFTCSVRSFRLLLRTFLNVYRDYL